VEEVNDAEDGECYFGIQYKRILLYSEKEALRGDTNKN
jgi:hypothetical protein